MIKRFHFLYVAQIALDNIGAGGTPANDRRYSNERLSEVSWIARAAPQCDFERLAQIGQRRRHADERIAGAGGVDRYDRQCRHRQNLAIGEIGDHPGSAAGHDKTLAQKAGDPHQIRPESRRFSLVRDDEIDVAQHLGVDRQRRRQVPPGFDRSVGVAARTTAAAAAGLLMAACAGSAPGSGWVKAGADNAATAHQAGDCRAQANAALANQSGINQDISATLGGNWQLARTTGVVDQSLRRQATEYAGQVFDSCMQAKGFKKSG